MVDSCGGLVTGAVAERLGGAGVVCGTQAGRRPLPHDLVRFFNLTAAQRSVLFTAPLEGLLDMLVQPPPPWPSISPTQPLKCPSCN